MKVSFTDIFLLCLGKPEKLVEYIKTNTDLSAYVRNHYSAYLNMAKLLLPNYPDIVKEGQTMDWVKISKILSEKRPDLYQILLMHDKNFAWLKSQKFKDFLDF